MVSSSGLPRLCHRLCDFHTARGAAPLSPLPFLSLLTGGVHDGALRPQVNQNLTVPPFKIFEETLRKCANNMQPR